MNVVFGARAAAASARDIWITIATPRVSLTGPPFLCNFMLKARPATASARGAERQPRRSRGISEYELRVRGESIASARGKMVRGNASIAAELLWLRTSLAIVLVNFLSIQKMLSAFNKYFVSIIILRRKNRNCEIFGRGFYVYGFGVGIHLRIYYTKRRLKKFVFTLT